jgi:hypothetical protein
MASPRGHQRDGATASEVGYAQLAARERELSEHIEPAEGQAGRPKEADPEVTHQRAVRTQERTHGSFSSPIREHIVDEARFGTLLGQVLASATK